ncbi:MAG: ribosome small subunit-dependent GTPase A [Lacipirellulaceae bacterium]
MAKKPSKIRTQFRRNHDAVTRDNSLTREYRSGGDETHGDADLHQRVSGKGRLTRKRTIAGGEVVEGAEGAMVLPAIDEAYCVPGRVLRVQGLVSQVRGDDGRLYACATRRLLKQLATDLRHVVAAGDRVWLRPEGAPDAAGVCEGIIERVEPRHGVVSRTSRNRRHLIATNLDQVVIVTSAAEPRLKPNLVDRFLVTAEKGAIRPIVCVNKIDLIDASDLVPLVGVYGQLGYSVMAVSATTGQGIDRLRALLVGKLTAFSGQSGVGKSSLLNTIHPGLGLRVSTVSGESQKGRHTTTTAELYPMGIADGAADGFLVDTPGIRSFELWDVAPNEVAGHFRELRPYVSRCRFPDCTHTHEEFCAVKDAVADGWIDERRYESFVQIQSGE